MLRKRRWLWVLLFVLVLVLLITLAAGWNFVLVQDYHQMLELARKVESSAQTAKPWASLIVGTLGFMVAMGTIILFFLKILKEMRLNQVQSEFLATVSHELKTPIASIELSSSLIRGGGLSADELERLWYSHGAELKRLREEVETLLQAARMEARGLRVRHSPLQLETWLTQSLERWNRILGPHSRIVREGDPLPCLASVELRTLNLITDNLVDNARKFSRGTPELVIWTQRIPGRGPWRRGRWHIEFRDQGWGFDPKDSRRIFTKFFRARTAAPYSIPGSGLGLYLASSASRALGLRLWAQSNGRGQGARFTLEGAESR